MLPGRSGPGQTPTVPGQGSGEVKAAESAKGPGLGTACWWPSMVHRGARRGPCAPGASLGSFLCGRLLGRGFGPSHGWKSDGLDGQALGHRCGCVPKPG